MDPTDKLQEHPEKDSQSSILGESAFDQGGGGVALPPPPLNLNQSQTLQRQSSGESPVDGFRTVEMIGVARDAPDEGKEATESGGVYLRSKPVGGSSDTIIRRIEYQEQFFIKGKSTNWYKVRTLKGEEGYVSKSLVSVNNADTLGFTVHVIQKGETAQGLAHKYYNSEESKAEVKPNELDYAKAIWAYNKQHYGKEIGIAKSSGQMYSLKAGTAIWIPSTDWAYRYIRDLDHGDRHGDSFSRWVYEGLTYDNPLVSGVRKELEALAKNWDPTNAQMILGKIKEHLISGRDIMVDVMGKVPAIAKFIVPGTEIATLFANFSVSFVIGALDQAASAPPEVLKQVLRSYLTAAIDPEFFLGLIEGAAKGIGNWFTDIGDSISMLGDFMGMVAKTVFSEETYTKEIPRLAKMVAAGLPELWSFIQDIEVSEVLGALQAGASSMGEKLGASAFSQLLQHLGNSPFGQGFSSGKIMGYLIPEIALAVGTQGIGTALKGVMTGLRGALKGMALVGKAALSALKRVGPFLDDLLRIAMQLANSGKSAASAFGKKFAAFVKRLKKALLGDSKMDKVRQKGQLGEEAAGIVAGNKKRIPSLTGSAQYRIPDELDEISMVLREVKNTKTLSKTKQIEDFLLYAQQKNLKFILEVGKNTKLTGPLQALVDNGSIILRRNPKF